MTIGPTAPPPDAQTVSRLHSVPGLGTMVRVVLLDEMPASTRVPRVQDGVSSCRVVTGAKASAGKREGTSGTAIGPASLPWAFSAAAVLGLRTPPAGHKSLARFENKHGTGTALTVVAQQLARAVYAMRKRAPVCERHTCLNGSGSGAGEPHASRDAPGLSLASGARMIARRQRTRRSPAALWP